MSLVMKTAASAFALLVALPACAQQAAPVTPPADADPALWVVKDADTTIYLFGTIHVLRPGLTWFDEAVKTAFDRSGQLVLEMVEPDAATAQAIVMAKAYAPTGPALTDQLPVGRRAAFTSAMADSGLPVAAMERMRPWFAALTLSIAPLRKVGYDPANGPEQILSDAAKRAGKPVIGLETFEGQMSIFDGLSQGAQIALLDSTVAELPQSEQLMARMVGDWSAGDPDALAREMNDNMKDSPEVAKALLADRNTRWASWIAERMKTPGTVFVAVGAGHLAGPQSVQAKLAPYRIKAVRIRY